MSFSGYSAWGVVEVIEFTRKHTANVHEALTDIRQIIEALVAKRDTRRDSFAKVVRQAMQTKLGADADEAQKVLSQNAIPRAIAREAVEAAMKQGRLTVFSMVDALTRLAGQMVNAGERTELDQKASQLLALAV
jgi:histone H3/H4